MENHQKDCTHTSPFCSGRSQTLCKAVSEQPFRVLSPWRRSNQHPRLSRSNAAGMSGPQHHPDEAGSDSLGSAPCTVSRAPSSGLSALCNLLLPKRLHQSTRGTLAPAPVFFFLALVTLCLVSGLWWDVEQQRDRGGDTPTVCPEEVQAQPLHPRLATLSSSSCLVTAVFFRGFCWASPFTSSFI